MIDAIDEQLEDFTTCSICYIVGLITTNRNTKNLNILAGNLLKIRELKK
jgi:hypothetical protein